MSGSQEKHPTIVSQADMTTASAPELNYIQANGLRFAYFEEGSGPLVLLLHGFPDTAHTWDQVRPALAAAGFRAVSPFTRGYAPTEVPREEAFDADTLGRDALALIEALGEKQAFLVGHWGASASFSAAGLMPNRIRKLITLALPHPLSLSFMPILFWPFVMWGSRHYFWLSRRGAADRIRARHMAYLDKLVQRWSPAWKVPSGGTDAVKKCRLTHRAVWRRHWATTAQRMAWAPPRRSGTRSRFLRWPSPGPTTSFRSQRLRERGSATYYRSLRDREDAGVPLHASGTPVPVHRGASTGVGRRRCLKGKRR